MKKNILLLSLTLLLFRFESQAQLTLSTDSILQLSTCAGGNIIVPYTVAGGSYSFGNVFTAQLSNNFGQFTNPVNIGTLFYWSSGIILCTIPANTNFGFLYKIRVIASNPQDTGAACPNTLFITQVAQLNQIISNPGDTMCSGDTITLTAINFANAYDWSTGDTTAQIQVTQPGIYTVTTTDILGCQSTTSDTVVSSLCLGVMENDLNDALEIYPNPSSGIINVSWKASGLHVLNIKMYNGEGKMVLQQKKAVSSISETSLDCSVFPAGIYFLTADDGNARTTRKIILE